MPWYETALVLDPHLEEEGISTKVQQYVDLLTSNGAEDMQMDRRGMRKLAYDIKGKDGEWRTQADYTFILYEAPPSIVRTVEEQLRLDEDVLRFLTVRHETLPPSNEESSDDSDNPIADEEE